MIDYKVGDRIVDYKPDGTLKRDLIITGIEYVKTKAKTGKQTVYNKKYYTYTCNICGWTEGKTLASSIKKGGYCSCCNKRVIVKGINDIATTHPHLIKYFVNISDAYTHPYGTLKKVLLKCPNCNFQKKLCIEQLTRDGFPCPKCSDGFSYSEKFLSSLLMQLNITFTTQLGRGTFSWCDNYKYDFYLPTYNCIIETHGKQHYGNNHFASYNERNDQEIDMIKKELALNNNISMYIVLDCRKSNPNWIKNSIYNSKLKDILDLSLVNWETCSLATTKSIMKDICMAWNSGKYISTYDLTKAVPVSRNTVAYYLKRGTELGWCNYNPHEELKKAGHRGGTSLGKKIYVYKDKTLIHIANSAQELSRNSIEIIGRFLYQADISRICNGTKKPLKDITLTYNKIKKE